MRIVVLLLTVSVFFPFCLKGQNYVPFPTKDATWNVYIESTCDNFSPADPELFRLKLEGDTSVNEVTYHKLIKETGSFDNPERRLIGGLREEEKRIYYYGEGFLGSYAGENVLLYDFTVQVGDTIHHTTDRFWKSIVLDTDSILIGDEYRRRYTVDNGWHYHHPDYIVEGIGSVLNGLLGHVSDIPTCGEHYWEHVAYIEDTTVIYQNPNFEDCYAGFGTNINEIFRSPIINMYPNPFTNSFNIESEYGYSDLRVNVFGLSGRLVHTSIIKANNSHISISGPSGPYLVRIQNSQGQVLWDEILLKQ